VSAAAVEQTAAGAFAVRGELGFATVAALAAGARPEFPPGGAVEIQLDSVTQTDSAGLALLMEWRRRAEDAGCKLQFTGAPAALAALAAVSGVAAFVFDGA